MDIAEDILTYDERAVMRLRALYRQFGYSQYKMSRFEEYSLYSENKAFLTSGEIITFTGAGGRLMALRPDVTLSIVKNIKDEGKLNKLYYNENVYRPEGGDFKEQMQVGLECIGELDVGTMGEVLMLALRSLDTLGGRPCLDVSHMGFINGLFDGAGLTQEERSDLLRSLGGRNAHELQALCLKFGVDRTLRDALSVLSKLYGPYEAVIGELRQISHNEETAGALREIEEVWGVLARLGADRDVNLDFSLVNDLSYYSGIIFQGYIKGVPEKIISGGRYDKLLRKFGKKSGAVGFAVYLNLLGQPDMADASADTDTISIALPKGRLGEKAHAMLEAAGYICPENPEESRRLVFEDRVSNVRYFWVKPSDVVIYVERGVADVGVAGKDILLEYGSDVYELLDLGIGKCRMCVSAGKGFSAGSVNRTLRVATKFPNIARGHFAKQGHDIDIIKLNGSIELAPLLGLSDVIVDIVETGATLRDNDMEPVETIVDISARLISNKVSHKFKNEAIMRLCDSISRA